MDPRTEFKRRLQEGAPVLALAPMQDVTDLAFWRLIARHGGPDIYWTEYFRVHRDSRLEPWILNSVTDNPTGRPAIAQLIGNDIPSLIRSAKELEQHPVSAIDLNLGCPAPVVYRKCAGGGLLRQLERVDSILGALRDAIQVPFTVKTRIGFESPAEFDLILPIFRKHAIDLLTIHGRTVVQMYRPGVRYDLIALAARELSCPVLANGNVHSAEHALAVLAQTGARGLMIGRGAIRNPWLFEQIRQRQRGESPTLPSGREVLAYIRDIWATQTTGCRAEVVQVQRMKKFMNFIGEGVPPAEKFLFEIRRVQTERDFFRVCEEHLDHEEPLRLEPGTSENAHGPGQQDGDNNQ